MSAFKKHGGSLSLALVSVLVGFGLTISPARGEPVSESKGNHSNTVSEAERAKLESPDHRQLMLICSLDRPSQVMRWYVSCANARYLDVSIADCCIAGDHFEAKAKVWDANPNTAVATAPGDVYAWSAPARVFNYGGTPYSHNLDAEVDCSYLHGVNVFPAGSYISLKSDGYCTATPLGTTDEIRRTP